MIALKIGHASYGDGYGGHVDFIVVNGNILVLDSFYGGLLGYAKNKEDAIALLNEGSDYDEKDLGEVIDWALQDVRDLKPYEKNSKEAKR